VNCVENPRSSIDFEARQIARRIWKLKPQLTAKFGQKKKKQIAVSDNSKILRPFGSYGEENTLLVFISPDRVSHSRKSLNNFVRSK